MKKLVVLVTQEGLGRVDPADRQFGVEMFDRFLHAFESQAVQPVCICFYTNGVKLVCEGSPALLGLRLLQGMGVRLVACRTCLEHFQVVDKVAVGEVAGMNENLGLTQDVDRQRFIGLGHWNSQHDIPTTFERKTLAGGLAGERAVELFQICPHPIE